MIHGIKRKKTPQELIDKKRRADAPKIREFQELVAQCQKNREAGKHDRDALEVTTELLELNPDNYMFWNIRREIFEKGIFVGNHGEASKDSLGNVTESSLGNTPNLNNPPNKLESGDEAILAKEMAFVLSKLKRFPKAYCIWTHREWCIDRMRDEEWQKELALVDFMLAKDPRNFHGWHYRRMVVNKLKSLGKTNLTETEFDYTTEKINQNFSNFSAWYNRALLIPKHLEHEPNRRAFLEKEIDYLRQAVFTDPDVSSVWFFHKWLYSNLELIDNEIGSIDKQRMISEEIEMIEELSEVEPNNSYCLIALVYLRDMLRNAGHIDQSLNDHKRRIEVYERLETIDPMRRNMYQAWKNRYLEC